MKPSQNLLSWQVFVATCRTRSISQAAVLLDIDLPKASRLLSALETELGEPLFDKSHRPIQPTPRAAELQRAVEPLVAGFQAALEPKAEPHERFTIRFAAPIELAQEYFSDKLFQSLKSSKAPTNYFTPNILRKSWSRLVVSVVHLDALAFPVAAT